MKISDAKKDHLRVEQKAPLNTPTDLRPEATKDITGALNEILADVFVLYLKTKNFHWHMSGRISAIIICCWTNSRISFLR